MDWNRCVFIISQVVVVAVLGSLVALGKDSAILDGLLAVTGSLAGINIIAAIPKKPPTA
jgi:hypothetical protein